MCAEGVPRVCEIMCEIVCEIALRLCRDCAEIVQAG